MSTAFYELFIRKPSQVVPSEAFSFTSKVGIFQYLHYINQGSEMYKRLENLLAIQFYIAFPIVRHSRMKTIRSIKCCSSDKCLQKFYCMRSFGARDEIFSVSTTTMSKFQMPKTTGA